MKVYEIVSEMIVQLSKIKANKLYQHAEIMEKISILRNGYFETTDLQLIYLNELLNDIYTIISCESLNELFSKLYSTSPKSQIDALKEFWDYSNKVNGMSFETEKLHKILGLYETKLLTNWFLPTLVCLSILHKMPQNCPLYNQELNVFYSDVLQLASHLSIRDS